MGDFIIQFTLNTRCNIILKVTVPISTAQNLVCWQYIFDLKQVPALDFGQ